MSIPKDMFVDPSTPPSPGPLITIERNGDPSTKVDFLILGDGYTAAERGKFERDARRMVDILFATSPFKERRRDFNVWGLVPGLGRLRHLSALDQRPSGLADRHDLRRLWFGTLHPDVQQPRLSRHRSVRTL